MNLERTCSGPRHDPPHKAHYLGSWRANSVLVYFYHTSNAPTTYAKNSDTWWEWANQQEWTLEGPEHAAAAEWGGHGRRGVLPGWERR